KILSSHALVDLGMNIRPGDNIEIQSMVRIRNDFGGFWGSGVTFDVRQLYVKGIIKDVVRYQIGDINYKLTPYTLYNNNQELSTMAPDVFRHLSQQVEYDNFFSDDNTWRQQGAALDFGIVFKKYLQSVDFNFFTSRIAATNTTSSPDRLFSAVNMSILQSKYFSLGVNYANLYDFAGTASTPVQFKNPVTTATANLYYGITDFAFTASGEAGAAVSEYVNDSVAPVLKDNFFDTRIAAEYLPLQIEIFLRMKSVGADFRSAGAQTKRLMFDTYPAAYNRITNAQILREFTMLDIMRESDLYNRQITNGLMAFDPKYNNINPYGDATPNRQGFETGINWTGLKDALRIETAIASFSEVRGQGTTDLRNFNRLSGSVELEIGKLLDWSRILSVKVNVQNDNTQRAGES
ncbi:MAG: hypothetical protein ACK4IY_09335, partial [Chitinophagales bacterium]